MLAALGGTFLKIILNKDSSVKNKAGILGIQTRLGIFVGIRIRDVKFHDLKRLIASVKASRRVMRQTLEDRRVRKGTDPVTSWLIKHQDINFNLHSNMTLFACLSFCQLGQI